ncbi:MAG TPA: YdiU family protein [Bacteroidia bacterium]|nr:YdiU family protein [Bacteroidia bacterium]
MPIPFDNTYARLPESFFARVEPTLVSAPEWIALNRELADELGIDSAWLDSDEGLAVLSGNRVPEGAEPLAAAYSGHQFGGFSPVLGDGRAILLGETVHRDGHRRDIQLKGSGPTPFSRRGDGRSALGPVLREYLVSEAMHALGVPTTRALAAVWSGDRVYREEVEPGGVFTRVARSHLRIGTCEYFASRGDLAGLRVLVDYALRRHYPDLTDVENPALALLDGVSGRQADLVAHWMSLGFIHGVMNTDNMSLSGETIDYGPCAFLDRYDPAKRFSYIDRGGRYAYGNQPNIALWNLTRLAEALLPLIDEDEAKAIERVSEVLDRFPGRFQSAWTDRFATKLGFERPAGEVHQLAETFLAELAAQSIDFTLAFRDLSEAGEEVGAERLLRHFRRAEPIGLWLDEWRAALEAQGISQTESQATMRRANPVFIPRNHRIEEVIAAAKEKDFAPFHRLHAILRRPFDEQSEAEEYERPPLPHEEVRATFCGT